MSPLYPGDVLGGGSLYSGGTLLGGSLYGASDPGGGSLYGGLLIADDANTVAHVYFNGNSLVDGFSNVWTQNGTVPQVARSGLTPPGAGPFSDANYYSLGTGNDVLDFAGDFSACLVLLPAAGDLSGAKVPFSNGTAATDGWFIQGNGVSTQFKLSTCAAAVTAPVVAGSAAEGAINVWCVGRASGTQYAKANLGTIASAAAATITPATTTTAKLGRYAGAGFAIAGTIYEAWFSTTTPTDALFTAIMQRVKARAGISAW